MTSVTVHDARRQARALLAEAKLDGLPERSARSAAIPLRFAEFVEEFWRDYAPHWKPSTRLRSRAAIDRVLVPFFGTKVLLGITRHDVLAFRQTRSHRPGSFHIELAVFSAMLGYAEKLKYRPAGSNPCRGVARFKRPLKERYLTAVEYRRLGTVLRGLEAEIPRSVAIVRLLICTGARKAEIEGLHWEWLTPDFARLPDSKSGPKRLYLNRSANAVLDRLGRAEQRAIFPPGATTLWRDWQRIRRAATIPDVRLHDLRHSFASVAITSGMPLLTVGRLLGHALPETTARYTHLADEAVHDAACRVSGSIAQVMGLLR